MKPLIAASKRKKTETVPFWFMRQAGRYLPEYRETRAQAGGFLDLAFNPALAAEVTLQPLRRYDMAAAIIFSDILVIPLALGQSVTFAVGEGPVLGPYDLQELSLEHVHERLKPVYEAIKTTRIAMAKEDFSETALIGFAGAPWTVACYMIEGKGGDFAKAKAFAAQNPQQMDRLVDMLAHATASYLCAQIEAGAEIVQIFDSWAGLLSAENFERWSIRSARVIVDRIRARHADIPIIGFPRGAGDLYARYATETGVDVLSLDQSVPLDQAQQLQKTVTVQGNLDPVLLTEGGEAMKKAAAVILDALGKGPFIFNLGHGINKETPPENVAILSDMIRNWR